MKYDNRYSEELPKLNDFLVNRVFLFKKTLKELKLNSNDAILEIGCDKGVFVDFLSKKFNAIGIDFNKDAINNSKSRNIRYMDITKNNFKDSSFDKIYSFHVIEHIPDLEKFFFEIDRILKKNGKIVLAYPYEPIRGIFTLRVAIKNRISPLKLHLHRITPKKIEKLLENTSLKHVKSKLYFKLIPQYITLIEKKN